MSSQKSPEYHQIHVKYTNRVFLHLDVACSSVLVQLSLTETSVLWRHTHTLSPCDRTVFGGGSMWAVSQQSLSSPLLLSLTHTQCLSTSLLSTHTNTHSISLPHFVSISCLSASLPPLCVILFFLSTSNFRCECENGRRRAKVTHKSRHQTHK